MEQMLRERIRSRGAKPGAASKPRSVSTALTAEWPVKSDNPEQLLLAVETLREQVNAADLAGTKASEKTSPEEQEEMEEAAAMMRDSYGEQAATWTYTSNDTGKFEWTRAEVPTPLTEVGAYAIEVQSGSNRAAITSCSWISPSRSEKAIP